MLIASVTGRTLVALATIGTLAVGACTPATSPPAPTSAPATAPASAPKPTSMASPAGAASPAAAAPASPSAASPAAAKPALATGDVAVFAASSLTDAFREIGMEFERANPAAKITFNFGASTQLRTQLEQGARADVFASADQAQMDAAKRANVVVGQDRVFARNRLVVITPRDNPRAITAVRDLGSAGVKFVTTQPSVPIGQYTLDLLDKATQDAAYGSDFRQRVEANIVSREDNVRQVVAKVQLGEADAGVVYTTDVTPQVRDQLTQIAVPDPLQTIATYPIAVTQGANGTGGEAFVTYVLSPPGQEVLRKWGFLPRDAAAPAP